jgi:5-(carboxyamino)imidazole ribonucleotide synthase
MGEESARPLPPGSVIGILGGGQLGRMLALAAARLGYRSHIFAPQPDAPALHVTNLASVAAYEETSALDAFAAAVDVVTIEFENIPEASVRRLEDQVPVRPRADILRIAQDRLREKDFLNDIGVATARYAEATTPEALVRSARDFGYPLVLKTARLGYDGKGQSRIGNPGEAAAAWAELDAPRGVVEAWVDFALEISVIVARGTDGAGASFPPAENRHVEHILDQTIVPARIDPELTMRAEATARHIAERLDLIGLLAVEMFVTRDGELLVNELAPRPHNSGHWTIDGCVTSQFEQCVRAVCGLPLGATDRHGDAIMKNLIGDEVAGWLGLLADPMAKLHLYGKAETRPGRKMGHVTRVTRRS